MIAEADHMVRFMKTAMLLLEHSQRDIERKLGVTKGYLNLLLRGAIELRFEHIVVIATAIGLKPGELLQAAFPLPEGPPTEAFRRLRSLGERAAPPPPQAVRPEVSPPSEEELERRMEKLVRRSLARLASALEELGA
jgi:transcriptional regulator with XRE-family HTH domain